MNGLEGICSACQSKHPVDNHRIHGYVMTEHNHQGGERCSGSGDISEVVIKDGKQIASSSMHDLDEYDWSP